jgi:hypothetical protein
MESRVDPAQAGIFIRRNSEDSHVLQIDSWFIFGTALVMYFRILNIM